VWLYKVKNPQGRIARWLMFLADIRFRIEYKKGSENIPADCMSRIWVNSIQLDRKTSKNLKYIIKEGHEYIGHAGIESTFLFLKSQIRREDLTKQAVKDYIIGCRTCLEYKNNNKKFVQHTSVLERSFKMIGIDCIGPLPKCNSGKRFIVIATDYVSKWVEARAIKNKTASEIAKFLVEEIFCRHGPVQVIRSDQGLEFMNKLVKLTTKLFESKMRYSSPYHPETNGLVERTNQSLILKLSKYVAEYKENWDKTIPFVLLQYRMSPIGKLSMTPFELLYGRKSHLPRFLEVVPSDFDLYFIDAEKYLEERLVKQKNSEELVLSQNQKRITHKLKQNKKCLASDDVSEGTIVLIRNRNKENKLDKKFIGPYIVIKNKLKGAYDVKCIETGETYAINRKDFVIWKDTGDIDDICSVLESNTNLNDGRVLPLVNSKDPIIKFDKSSIN
jgi:hypothetical protein